MGLIGTSCVLLLAVHVASAASTSAASHTVDDPTQVVWRMLEAFTNRSETDYVAWMTDDFRFDSDDPDFGGMSRADEEQFARHLFRGGKTSPDGRALPTATGLQLSVGPVSEAAEGMPDGQAHVTLPHLMERIAFSDGSTTDVGDTQNEFWLVRTQAGWRVRRWQEVHPALAALDSDAKRPAHGASTRDSVWGEPVAQVPVAPGAIARLALAPRVNRDRKGLVFDVALPAPGGSLELFDVMGRRVDRHDLSDLGAGHHVVALDGHQLNAGVYWARVRQGANGATARVLVIR